MDIAGEGGRAQQILLAGQKQFGFVGAGMHLVGCRCALDSAFTFPLARMRCTSFVRPEEECGLIRLQGSVRTLHAGMFQHDFMRVVRDYAVSSEEVPRPRSAQRHVNLRSQSERVAFAGILDAYGPAGGLGCAKVNARIGGGVSAVLVEDSSLVLRWMGFLSSLGVP